MMASENIDLPKLDEPSKPVGLNLRRNSSGKAVRGDRKEKVIPHYLRASTGSCHDLCKYGRKHVHDVKERIPISKRAVTKSFDGLNTQDTCTNNPSTVKVMRFLHLKSHSADGFSTNQEGISIASCNSQSQVKNEVLGKSIESSSGKVKTTPILDSRTSIVSGTTKRRSSLASKKLETSSKISSLKPNVKLPAKHVALSTQSSIKASMTKSTESLMVKNGTPKSASAPKPVSTSKFSNALREGVHETEKALTTSKVTLKKSWRYPVASLSPRSPLKQVASFHSRRNRTLKIASHLKNQHKLKKCSSEEQSDNVVEEKTLYVVKVESGNKPDQSSSAKWSSSSSHSFSSQEDQEESNLLINGYEDATCLANNVSGNVEKQVTVEKQETITEKRTVKPRRDVSNCCENKDCQPLSSRSSRGKIVDIRSHTNNPRRLRFRRGRVMDETTSFKADARRRNFKRTSGDGDDVVETASGPQKVVLKHQDVQDKKEVQCLLNNVIEETASKLVESKKSKVRALVSAFETVISLQERKPDISIVN